MHNSFNLKSDSVTFGKFDTKCFVFEADTVGWEIGEFVKYLWGSEFNVLSDCSEQGNFSNQGFM